MEFSIRYKRWNQMEVYVLGDNALDIMETCVGWDSMLQEPFFFFSRDRFPLDQSKQCLEGFRNFMSHKIVGVGQGIILPSKEALAG